MHNPFIHYHAKSPSVKQTMGLTQTWQRQRTAVKNYFGKHRVDKTAKKQAAKCSTTMGLPAHELFAGAKQTRLAGRRAPSSRRSLFQMASISLSGSGSGSTTDDDEEMLAALALGRRRDYSNSYWPSYYKRGILSRRNIDLDHMTDVDLDDERCQYLDNRFDDDTLSTLSGSSDSAGDLGAGMPDDTSTPKVVVVVGVNRAFPCPGFFGYERDCVSWLWEERRKSRNSSKSIKTAMRLRVALELLGLDTDKMEEELSNTDYPHRVCGADGGPARVAMV